jgi:hypothetical protein
MFAEALSFSESDGGTGDGGTSTDASTPSDGSDAGNDPNDDSGTGYSCAAGRVGGHTHTSPSFAFVLVALAAGLVSRRRTR